MNEQDRDLKKRSQKAEPKKVTVVALFRKTKNEKKERALFEYALKHILTSSDKWLAWNAYMEWSFRRYIFIRHDRPAPPAPKPQCPKNSKREEEWKKMRPQRREGREGTKRLDREESGGWMGGERTTTEMATLDLSLSQKAVELWECVCASLFTFFLRRAQLKKGRARSRKR
ncbi:hypothetical protein B9Z55_025642 [Caenorhabditis nigoni]|uniref:Uncharacterized protein n=1 Tax=Caenorhabditis nigoni TaxID=1611254 RepID=A0A2G5T005_9PELO|nr:hypothetical protein B9Z55_025642 [Caenorhabditis nigoni]